MKKCYAVFNERARFIGAIGIFYPIGREFFATSPADALRQFAEKIETAGPASTVKEWESPFDADALFNYVQNEPHLHGKARTYTDLLRGLVGTAARQLAQHNKNWHDAPEADDHPLYHADEQDQFPRELRNEAIIELVRRHLEIIDDNETAPKSKEVKGE